MRNKVTSLVYDPIKILKNLKKKQNRRIIVLGKWSFVSGGTPRGEHVTPHQTPILFLRVGLFCQVSDEVFNEV